MFTYCGNNPANYSDSEGFWPHKSTVIVQEGFTRDNAGVLGITTGSPVKDIAAAAGGAVAGSAIASVIHYVQTTIQEIADSIKVTQEGQSSAGPYTVYVLTDVGGTVQYVGRTKNPAARKAAHAANPARKDFAFSPVGSNLNYQQARGLEQLLMLYFHTIKPNPGNPRNNQINGISPNNDNLDAYILAAEKASGYIWNQVSNEILCWAGK